MAEDIITYETLYEILRKEKYETDLNKLNDDFFKAVITYLEEKNAILISQKQKDSIFASKEIEKTERQIQNIRRILKELYDRRENKIIQAAIFASRSNQALEANGLKEEKQLLSDLTNLLKNYRQAILNNLLNAKAPSIEKPKELKNEEKEPETRLIRFIQPVPRFVGDDMNIYGPFEEEDMANLPSKIAEIIINNKRAEII